MVLRSLLFVPGNVSRRIEKALRLDADVVIIDLEDSVPIGEKKQARTTVVEWLGKPRQAVGYVRVNSLSTGLTIDDMDAVVSSLIDGVILPKVESSSDIEKVDWYISYLEAKHSLSLGSIDLIPLVENAKGIQNAFDIGKAVIRVKRLCFGGIDYATDIGVKNTDNALELLYARTHLVNSSRAAGLEAPIDTVYPDIKNLESLEQDTRLASQLGFQGKLVIHPDQINTVNMIFTPSKDDVAFARKVIDAFEKAEAEGRAAIMLDDGKFIDYPVVQNARRIINNAEKCSSKK